MSKKEKKMWDIWSDPIINKLITLIADPRKTFSSWFSGHFYQEIICNMFLLEVAVDSLRYGSWLQFEINVFCTPLFQLYCVLKPQSVYQKNKHQIFFLYTTWMHCVPIIVSRMWVFFIWLPVQLYMNS